MYHQNGEPKLFDRMEDEEWYRDYQSLLEWSISDEKYTIEELMNLFDKDYEEIFGKRFENREQLLRWCTFLTERHNNFLWAIEKGYMRV